LIKINTRYYNKEEYIKDAADFAKKDYNNRIKLINRFIDLKKISNIVELGCGAGTLSKIHKNYIGLDISKNAIKNLKCAICCDIGKKIPLDARSVDSIISFNTLEHIVNVEKTLEECARIIKPKGKLLFVEGFNVSRTNMIFHLIKIFYLRILSFFVYVFLNKKKFIYFKIKADYSKIGGDYDACSQIDPYVMYLWFKKQGFKCLNKKDLLRGILWKDKFIVLEKQ